ncbi:MAG: hypothetical protein ABJH82_09405 [Polaribacter sp.]|uniref:hypothetical protein n=1 Tax=Polaribacter sp. TaxID=1920175 RepID=UPI0032676613
MKVLKLIFFLFFISFNLNSQNIKENLIGVWSFKSNLNENHFILSKENSLTFKNIGYQFLENQKLIVRHFENFRICMLSDLRFINYNKGIWKIENNIISLNWLRNKKIKEKWIVLKSTKEELEIKIIK